MAIFVGLCRRPVLQHKTAAAIIANGAHTGHQTLGRDLPKFADEPDDENNANGAPENDRPYG